MRVRLVDGGDRSYDQGRTGLWCAGRVPVGTLGTVVRDGSNGFSGPHIVWDRVKPRAGYVFAVGVDLGQPLPRMYVGVEP